MSFLIKKIIAALVLPVPMAIILLIIGLIFLYFFHLTQSGKLLVLLSTLILFIFSTQWVPNCLIKSLETQYKPLTEIPNGVKDIVVLGAGNGAYTIYPANNQLSSASLARLIEGIRLNKLIPASTLILSGGRVFGSPPNSVVMNNVATMLGVTPDHIEIKGGSKDTYEEARNLKKVLGKQPFILVTSAYHMPRAMGLFQHQGMNPIAGPTQLLLGKQHYTVKHYLPNATSLVYSDIAIHEYLGILWAKLTNKM